jgi:type I restriction enzyme S subunit
MNQSKNLPMGWRWSRLGDVAQYINGRAFKPQDWGTRGLPIIRIQNLNTINASFNYYDGNIEDRYRVKDGDLLISWSASLDAFIWQRGDAVLNQHIFNVHENPHIIIRKYLYYVVRTVMSEIRSQVHGATMQHITKPKFEAIPIPLPPLDEQRRIAAVLDKADALREKRRQAVNKLDTLLQAVFLDMFGDLVKNPKGWPERELGELCTRVTVGFVGPMINEYIAEGIPLLRSLNVKRGRIDLKEMKYIGQDFHNKLSKSKLNPGDVVAVRTGKPGVSSVIPEYLTDANCADLIVMTCGNEIEPNFLCEVLNQRLGDRDYIQGTVGAIQTHFNIGRAKELRLAVPPIELQKQFAGWVRKVKALAEKYSIALNKSNDLFSSLQSRAFSGELFNGKATAAALPPKTVTISQPELFD